MEKKGSFLVAFVLFSVTIFTVAGLNFSADRLLILESPDAVLTIEQTGEGLELTLFDSSCLLPRFALERLQAGSRQLRRTALLLMPARYQVVLGASSLLCRAVLSP